MNEWIYEYKVYSYWLNFVLVYIILERWRRLQQVKKNLGSFTSTKAVTSWRLTECISPTALIFHRYAKVRVWQSKTNKSKEWQQRRTDLEPKEAHSRNTYKHCKRFQLFSPHEQDKPCKAVQITSSPQLALWPCGRAPGFKWDSASYLYEILQTALVNKKHVLVFTQLWNYKCDVTRYNAQHSLTLQLRKWYVALQAYRPKV